MSATGSGYMSSFASRSGLPTFGNFGNTLLERSNPGLRKSTPDSEALASSDEEVEQSRLRSAQRKTTSNRRSSLLGDQNHGDLRQFPHSSSHPYSPSTGSQPNTPSVSQDTWTSISPSLSAWNTAPAYPFGPNIWGANSRDPPARLQEVKQDNHTADNRFPFPVPPQSNPAVQRSMSFSVGQSDYEPTSTMDYSSRAIPGLTRRSSRPANMGHDFGGLARVNESDDPEDPYAVAPPNMSNLPVRNVTRTLSSTSTPTNHSLFRSSRSNLNQPGLDISEIAIEEFDDHRDMHRAHREPRQAPAVRRMTENAPIRQPHNPSTLNTGFTSNSRTAPTWSSVPSSTQFNTAASRRHSFAEMPTRRGTPGSQGMLRIPLSPMARNHIPVPIYEIPYSKLLMTWSDDPNTLNLTAINDQFIDEISPGPVPDYYFAKNDAAKYRVEQGMQRQIAEDYQQSVNRHNRPQPVMHSLPVHTEPVDPNKEDPDLEIYYVINFKCCRSDIYKIKEGSEIAVNEGDLVIVEADRGEDLGCVMHGPMDKHTAEKYKLKYSEQHFGWLMMFTAQAHTGSENPLNPNAAFSAGPAPKHQYNQAEKASDNRAKKIKRHAIPVELDKLQLKEGLEAKAKRDCQAKVNEHGFNMEILDAEYQLDMRKLTFFFFSTEYINFNILVTDLFKKFKTRIWMFAINPASFQSPLSSMTITPIQQNLPYGNVMPNRDAAHVFTSGNRYGSYLTAYQGAPLTEFNSAYAQPMSNPYNNFAPGYAPQQPAAYQQHSGYAPAPGYQSGYAQAPTNYAQQPAVDPFNSFNNGYGGQGGQSTTWTPNNYRFENGGNSNGRNGRPDNSANDLSGRFNNLNLRR